MTTRETPPMADVKYVMVPKSALDWLFGEGPDANGQDFGESVMIEGVSLVGKYKRTYWWRSHFRKLIKSASPPVDWEKIGPKLAIELGALVDTADSFLGDYIVQHDTDASIRTLETPARILAEAILNARAAIRKADYPNGN